MKTSPEASNSAPRAIRQSSASRTTRNLSAATLRAALFVLAAFFAPAAFGQGSGADAPARLTLKSEVLGEERVAIIRTPAGYERNGERYPVLYMTDGDAHILHTTGTVQFLSRNGRMPEMIVVAITNTDRTRDLTPTRASVRRPDGAAQLFPTSGGADKFLKFIETELIPAVEARYRTLPYRAFAGHSFGGLFAVHAMLSRPDLFNAYVAVSPSLQWDDFIMLKRATEFFKGRDEFKKTLFVSLGNEPGGIGQGFEQFRTLLSGLKVKGFEWEAQKYDDEDHGSVVLRSHYAGLRKVFDGWQLRRDPTTGAVPGGLKGADEHYRKLSERFGYSIPTPEALINFIGYQHLGAGDVEEAIAVFKTNVERYPKSANVYDSLAEAYERAGKLDLAKPNYERAALLGAESADPNLNIFKANLERVAGLLKNAEGKGDKQATGNK
jgi:predicted alpha/beta superfamily hydrolase